MLEAPLPRTRRLRRGHGERDVSHDREIPTSGGFDEREVGVPRQGVVHLDEIDTELDQRVDGRGRVLGAGEVPGNGMTPALPWTVEQRADGPQPRRVERAIAQRPSSGRQRIAARSHVPHAGDAMPQKELPRLGWQIEGVNMHIPQTRDEKLAMSIDRRDAPRGGGASGADGDDAPSGNHDIVIPEHGVAVHRQDIDTTDDEGGDRDGLCGQGGDIGQDHRGERQNGGKHQSALGKLRHVHLDIPNPDLVVRDVRQAWR